MEKKITIIEIINTIAAILAFICALRGIMDFDILDFFIFFFMGCGNVLNLIKEIKRFR